MKIKIEKDTSFNSIFQSIAEYEKEETRLLFTYGRIKDYFSRCKEIIFGRGGHHIWFALKDKPNERIAIITE